MISSINGAQASFLVRLKPFLSLEEREHHSTGPD